MEHVWVMKMKFNTVAQLNAHLGPNGEHTARVLSLVVAV